jgi:LmbE family N-acetylglucosaminyl deacetylase
MKILGIYAHPDDETFCAGGTLARYATLGAEVMVFSATRGEAGQIRDAHAATRRTLGQAREQEQHAACAALGIQQVTCLNYGDGRLAQCNKDALKAEVVQAVRSFQPQVVLTFGNDGAYGHPDHITIGALVDEAFTLAADPHAYPEQIAAGLPLHQPISLYHSYFPRSRRLLLNQLVRWFKDMDKRFHGSFDFLRGLLYLADESTALGYTSDNIDVQWYPAGFSIVEQGEPATSLYLILSGAVDVLQEEADGALFKVNELHSGDFFGEQGIAQNQPRSAYCVAQDNVSCLVFSPAAPTAFAGRGDEANYTFNEKQAELEDLRATTCIDVLPYVPQKITAISAYRSQFPMHAELFPRFIWDEMLGREYFVRIQPRPVLEQELVFE